jgi:hypothetical protein
MRFFANTSVRDFKMADSIEKIVTNVKGNNYVLTSNRCSNNANFKIKAIKHAEQTYDVQLQSNKKIQFLRGKRLHVEASLLFSSNPLHSR